MKHLSVTDNGKARRRFGRVIRDELKEDGQCEKDCDGQGDLLAGVGRKPEDEQCQTRQDGKGKDHVVDVELIVAFHVDVKHEPQVPFHCGVAHGYFVDLPFGANVLRLLTNVLWLVANEEFVGWTRPGLNFQCTILLI